MTKIRLPRWATVLIAGVAGVAVVWFVGWLLLVPAADWLSRHDVGSAVGPTLETARNNARGSLVALAAGLVATAALIFTALNFTLQQKQLQQARADADRAARASQRTLELTEQGQSTERFTRAVEQLGSDKSDVRLGGIYALERIMVDSARDHPAIVELLAAFVRRRAGHWPPPKDANPDPELDPVDDDVLAAVSVLGRRPPNDNERLPVNLRNVVLSDVDLTGADLSNVDLSWANLSGTTIQQGDLTDARLIHAELSDARLVNCTMLRADLTWATLSRARLDGVDLTEAIMNKSTLIQTSLRNATMHYVSLKGADLTDARLKGADLTGAITTSAKLSDTELTSEQENALRMRRRLTAATDL